MTKSESSATGVFHDWTFERYLSCNAFNQGWLKKALDVSPRVAERERKAPDKNEEHFTIGHLFEAMIESPEKWEEGFFEVECVDKVTNAGEREEVALRLDIVKPGTRDKKFKNYDALYKECFSLTKKRLVTGFMVKACEAMVETCKSLPIVRDILFNKSAEYQLSLVDRVNGVLVKGRADVVVPVGALSDYTRDYLVRHNAEFANKQAVVLLDIKTAVSAAPTAIGFRQMATKLDYFFQVVFYARLLSSLLGVVVIPMILAVQKPLLDDLEKCASTACEAVLYPIDVNAVPVIEDRINQALEIARKMLVNGLDGYPEVSVLKPLTYYGG